ncbi:MAG: 2Fe-2S iron-sulfur cluster-binding protein, partial [Desulfatiglandales bacterium]
MKEAMVIFQPSGRRGNVPLGENLIEASRRLGVDIESLCGEKTLCGKCKVRIEEGRENLTPFQKEEERFISSAEKGDGLRLACAAKIRGNVLIFVPEETRASRQVIRKAATKRRIKINPTVKIYPLTLKEATIEDPLGDFERLNQALEEGYGLKDMTLDLEV